VPNEQQPLDLDRVALRLGHLVLQCLGYEQALEARDATIAQLQVPPVPSPGEPDAR
jgi:hypothetical protein